MTSSESKSALLLIASRYEEVVHHDIPVLREADWLLICSRLEGIDVLTLDSLSAEICSSVEDVSDDADEAAIAFYKEHLNDDDQEEYGWVHDDPESRDVLRIAVEIRRMSMGQRAALLGVVERFWRLDDEIDASVRLKRVGARISAT